MKEKQRMLVFHPKGCISEVRISHLNGKIWEIVRISVVIGHCLKGNKSTERW